MKIKFKIAVVGFAAVFLAAAGLVLAANPGAISSLAGEHFAWNDVIGWLDFGNGTVTVTNSKLTGYTTDAPPGSQYGNIALDCATSPNGPICAANGGFDWWVANDGSGNLSGWAWSDAIGWISFCGNSTAGSGPMGGCPGSPTYQVRIDTSVSPGDFFGWAWNDVVGWIGFNCNNPETFGSCVASNYKVKTSWSNLPPGPSGGPGGGFDLNTWLESSTLDTRVTGGAAFNTISWQGSQPAGTRVGFQIAVSNNSTGPWNYTGWSGDATTVYEPSGPNAQLPLDQAAALRRNTNNNRYVRYKVWLAWAGAVGPRVDDVIISYSP